VTVPDAMIAELKCMSWQLLAVRQEFLLIFIFTGVFLLMELFWRMLFEFLIAYLQIRDALLQMMVL
jgi:hypothetical protein